jgi:hypothetical protein
MWRRALDIDGIGESVDPTGFAAFRRSAEGVLDDVSHAVSTVPLGAGLVPDPASGLVPLVVGHTRVIGV